MPNNTMDGSKSAILILFLLSSFWEEAVSVGMLKVEGEHDQRFDGHWSGFSVRRLKTSKRRWNPHVPPPTGNGRVSWGAPPAYRYQSPPPPAPSQPMPSPPTLPKPPPGPRLL